MMVPIVYIGAIAAFVSLVSVQSMAHASSNANSNGLNSNGKCSAHVFQYSTADSAVSSMRWTASKSSLIHESSHSPCGDGRVND